MRPMYSKPLSSTSTHCVDSCQQEFGDACQDLSDRHLITEQQVCEVRPLHPLVQEHRLLDLLHFFLHQRVSYDAQEENSSFSFLMGKPTLRGDGLNTFAH